MLSALLERRSTLLLFYAVRPVPGECMRDFSMPEGRWDWTLVLFFFFLVFSLVALEWLMRTRDHGVFARLDSSVDSRGGVTFQD